MKIAIVGESGSADVGEFVNGVLFAALVRPENADYGFQIRETNSEGEVMFTARRGDEAILIHTFATPEAAARWLMELP